jgi:hypothetical protein
LHVRAQDAMEVCSCVWLRCVSMRTCVSDAALWLLRMVHGRE